MRDEFDHRFAAAKRQTDAVKSDLRELYMYLFNGREREWDAHTKRWSEPEEIFDSTAAEANLEFTSDLFSNTTPDTDEWVQFEAGAAIPPDRKQEVNDYIAGYEAHIADAILSSNYYHVGPSVFSEAGIGTIAMWCDRHRITTAIHCEPVPLSELHFITGANGLEDRFREKRHWIRDLPILFPTGNFPKKTLDKIRDDKGNGIARVCWGFWRDYSDPVNPIWIHQAKVDGDLVLTETLGPDGACPLLLGRFNPVPHAAHGRGPAWMMLPEIRTIDSVRRMVLENLDKQVDPAMVYVRDGLLDFTDGVEAGMAYPAMPGSADEIKALGHEGNLDYGLFTLEELRRIIRRGFYRKDEQRGKTPPSASQFMGEEQSEIRRMARPAAPLFSEFVMPFLKRVEYLEVQAGFLPEQITTDNAVVNLRPISPLMRAQAREKVVLSESILTMAANTMGEQAALVIDGPTTIANIKAELGDRIVAIRSAEEMQQIMQQMQGQQPNAT